MSAIKCCRCGAVSDSDGARLACGRCADAAEAEVRRHEERIKDYENEPGWREIVAERMRTEKARADAAEANFLDAHRAITEWMEKYARLETALREIADCACAASRMNGQCTEVCHDIARRELEPEP